LENAVAENSISENSVYTNALFHGDNKEILAHLLANGLRGQVQLIYIDPPFDSGADYVRQVRLRGDNAKRIAGENYTVGEQVQYTDIWANDNYLQFIYERLPLMRELLAPTGTIWLHCDHRKTHQLRMLLEEVFGEDNYLNTIAWRSQVARGAKVNAFYFPFSAHWIEIFAKDRTTPPTWHAPKKIIRLTEKEAARQYMRDEHGFFRTSDPGSYSFARLVEFHAVDRLYAPYNGEVILDQVNERVYGSNGGTIALKYYLTAEADGTYRTEQTIDNLWDDIPGLATTPGEEVGYPTQKTEALLERILRVATDPGDLVLDCFMGSGTTPAVAQKLNRRWIGCDINRGSIQTVSRRLQRIITTQLAEATAESSTEQPFDQAGISTGDKSSSGKSSSGKSSSGISRLQAATFAVYRINGYDIRLEDRQARAGGESAQAAMVQLATDAVGVRRTRTDSFFEGMLGERLVKFADFGRPLLVADLDAIAAELATRAEDLRDIVVICLGRELATEDWVHEWNRHRGGQLPQSGERIEKREAIASPTRLQSHKSRLKHGLNHLEVIELQSDQRYGHFFIHESAEATLSIRSIATQPGTKRTHTSAIEIIVQVDDFISPTVVHRLHQQKHVEPLLIDDWRMMVDSIAIDPAYDNVTFRAVIADAPHKRTDLVVGTYHLRNVSPTATIAVKITDMLGEELLITQQVDV